MTVDDLKQKLATKLAPAPFERDDLLWLAATAGDVAVIYCQKRQGRNKGAQLFSDYIAPPSATVIDSRALAVFLNKSGPAAPDVLARVARENGWHQHSLELPIEIVWGLRAFVATYVGLLPALRLDETQRAEAQVAIETAERNNLDPKLRRRVGILAALRDPHTRTAVLAVAKRKLAKLAEKPKRGPGGKFLPRK